jgi:hypothetical protein
MLRSRINGTLHPSPLYSFLTGDICSDSSDSSLTFKEKEIFPNSVLGEEYTYLSG